MLDRLQVTLFENILNKKLLYFWKVLAYTCAQIATVKNKIRKSSNAQIARVKYVKTAYKFRMSNKMALILKSNANAVGN